MPVELREARGHRLAPIVEPSAPICQERPPRAELGARNALQPRHKVVPVEDSALGHDERHAPVGDALAEGELAPKGVIVTEDDGDAACDDGLIEAGARERVSGRLETKCGAAHRAQ